MNDLAAVNTVQAFSAIPSVQQSKLSFPAIDCQIKSSTLTCLVGPHRFQLRTYLHMLAGITKPFSGKVTIFGHAVSQLGQAEWQKLRSGIGYLSGTSPLLASQHGLMNVMLPALYHDNRAFRETADKARVLLDELNCHFDVTKFPAELTSFQRLQLALARALILDPPLLFLDVPFHDLGAKQREKMGMILGEHKQQRAVCMIGGLQYVHFLEQHASQIIFISEHKVIVFDSWNSFLQAEDCDVKELFSVPSSVN